MLPRAREEPPKPDRSKSQGSRAHLYSICGLALRHAKRIPDLAGQLGVTGFNRPLCATGIIRTALRKVASAALRRHLTVLFCDLIGSTEISALPRSRRMARDRGGLSSRCGRSDYAFRRVCGEISWRRHHGYFGWPEVHDNDAERAGRAGLATVDAVGALNLRDGQNGRPKPSIRVGIDSGNVVIGQGRRDRIGSLRRCCQHRCASAVGGRSGRGSCHSMNS